MSGSRDATRTTFATLCHFAARAIIPNPRTSTGALPTGSPSKQILRSDSQVFPIVKVQIFIVMIHKIFPINWLIYFEILKMHTLLESCFRLSSRKWFQECSKTIFSSSDEIAKLPRQTSSTLSSTLLENTSLQTLITFNFTPKCSNKRTPNFTRWYFNNIPSARG